MQRRKFIIGLGAASASGSALIGSGAFSSVAAERDIAVDVADDSDAFLRLAPCTDDEGNEKPNGAYVDNTDGLLSISLSGDNDRSPPAGSGVNPEAVSTFHNVFEMCNQGTQEVCIDFSVDALPIIPNGTDVPDRYDFNDGDLAVTFYRGDDPDDPINVAQLDPGRDGAFPLPVGECQCVGIKVRAFGFESGEDLFEDTELTILADADAECSNSPPEDRPNEPGEELELVYADSVGETQQGVNDDETEIDDDRSDPEAALGEENDDFFSLGFRPAGADWDWDGGGRLVLEFDEENELVKRPYDTDVLNVETTGGRDDYPEEKALVEVAGPGTNGEFVEVGTATSKVSDGTNTFELPAEPIRKVRLTDQSNKEIDWPYPPADGFDVDAVGGFSEKEE